MRELHIHTNTHTHIYIYIRTCLFSSHRKMIKEKKPMAPWVNKKMKLKSRATLPRYDRFLAALASSVSSLNVIMVYLVRVCVYAWWWWWWWCEGVSESERGGNIHVCACTDTYSVRHSVQREKALSSFIVRHLSKHSLCTHFDPPLQEQGAMRFRLVSSSRQMRHCNSMVYSLNNTTVNELKQHARGAKK